jgi:type II secretory pathway component PulM
MSSPRSDFSTGRRATRPSLDPSLQPADLQNWFPSERPSLGNRVSRALARFLITLCIGVAATLAWQSYGDEAREMLASASPRLGWLAPQAAPVARTAPDVIAPTAPAAPSRDQQQLNAMSLSLAAVRQSVDQLAAGQEQMTLDITKLQTATQGILDKISAPPPRPVGATTRKPAPQTTPVH